MEKGLAIVTGASAGLGVCLAREAAASGYRPLLVARRQDRLEALAETLPGALVFAADLTAPDAIEALMGFAAAEGPVTALINNAGFGQSGPLVEGSRDKDLAMIDLNVRALVDLTHRVLPGMVAAGRGGVMNVASAAGFQPGPNASVYYATKAFVVSFSEAISAEMAGTGVTVTALCPGPTETEFFAVSGMDKVRLRKVLSPMSAEAVARIGWRGFVRGRRVVVPGWRTKFAVLAGRHAPRTLTLPMVKALQSR
ncbi:MAG: SDR family oxidoreductase [Pseudomonadota bacterium]